MAELAAHPKKLQYLVGLKPRRKNAKLTQEDLAREIGTTRESIRGWESGLYWPSAQFLPGIARTLGCSIEELYREPEAEDDEQA